MIKYLRSILLLFLLFPVTLYSQERDDPVDNIEYILEASRLTAEEKAWIYEKRHVNVGISFASYHSDSNSPFPFLIEKDEHFLIDFLEKIFSAVEIDVDFSMFSQPGDMENLFRKGKLDVMIGSFIVDPCPDDRLYGEVILSNPMAVFSREDRENNVSLDDLQDKKVGVISEGAASYYLSRDYPDIILAEFNSYSESLEELKKGEIEAFIGDLNAVTEIIKKYFGPDFVVSQVTDYNIDYAIAVRSDWPEMVGIIDKLFKTLSHKDKAALFSALTRMMMDDWRKWIPVILIGGGAFFLLSLISFFTAALNKKLKREVRQKERIRKNLIKANDELERSNEAKSQFLANMSHEIRTPMNAIIGLTHLALKTELNEKQREYLEKINSSADNLLVIINDILDFSKIDAGKLSLDNVPFNIGDVLENMETLFARAAEDKEIKFTISMDEDVPQILRGDPLRLGQILINLTGNAVKFTENGWIELKVSRVYGGKKECVLLFSVKDSGIGLTEDQRKALFRPFTQADGATTRKFGGTGLGLAISRELTGMMGGEIDVESRYGEGSDFHFTAKFEIASEDEIIANSISDNSDERFVFPDARILLVEDNKINQEVAVEILKEAEISVDIAENGRIAVDMLRENPNRWDLVLMDILMPEMDGYTATGIIRNSLHLSGLPVIAMTASAMAGDKEKSIEAGMDDYVQKPIDARHLLSTLRKYLVGGRKTGEEESRNLTDKKPELGEKYTEEFVLPENLPGIDIESGLLRMGGNVDLYKRMLVRFFYDEKEWVVRFSETLKNRDIDEALRMAHTMKSVGGNIGAETLSKEAERLESLIREHPQMCRMINPGKVGRELNTVIKGIEPNIVKVRKKRILKKKESGENMHLLSGCLEDLLPNLEMRRQRPSRQILEKMEELFESGDELPEFRDIEGLIRKYRYEDAAVKVKEMLASIKGGKLNENDQ